MKMDVEEVVDLANPFLERANQNKFPAALLQKRRPLEKSTVQFPAALLPKLPPREKLHGSSPAAPLPKRPPLERSTAQSPRLFFKSNTNSKPETLNPDSNHNSNALSRTDANRRPPTRSSKP